MNTNRFIVCIKTDDIYKDIAEVAETRFNTSNYELDGLLQKENNNNCINERWIRWKNHDKMCSIKSKHKVFTYRWQ